MIDVNRAKVKDILQGFHENVIERFKKQHAKNDELLLLSRVVEVLYEDCEAEPRRCASELNEKYGYDLDGDDIIALFRRKYMANRYERAETFRWAAAVAKLVGNAIVGDKAAYDTLQVERRKTIITIDGRKNPQNYIAAHCIFLMHPELNVYGSADVLRSLDVLLGKYFFYDFIDALGAAYGFETYRAAKKQHSIQPHTLSSQELMDKILQLENRLAMTNSMLQDLQDDFDDQLATVKIMELTEFFASLNSEKYGYILDELLMLRKGVDELRAKNFDVPLELNGVLILVKKMIQFVRDSHINPIMKINEIKKVKAADIEYCNYDGSPFISNDERKTVRVVSPGWLYKDKEIQISRPKLKEIDSHE